MIKLLKLTRPHGQLLKSFFLGAGVLGQDQRCVRVGQRRSEACVVFESLTSCGFLTFVLEYGPVGGQRGPAAREPGGPDAKHPVQSNNGAPTLGGHFDKDTDPTSHTTKTLRIPPVSAALGSDVVRRSGEDGFLHWMSSPSATWCEKSAGRSKVFSHSSRTLFFLRSSSDPRSTLPNSFIIRAAAAANAPPRPYTARTIRRKQH